MRIGAHVSVAGGLYRACERAAELAIRVMQIFTKSERQWKAAPLDDGAVDAYRTAARRAGIEVAFAHASYLVNIASGDSALWRRSVAALREELERCEALGLSWLVVHPGSPGNGAARQGVRRMVRALDRIHAGTRGYRARILLETSAGQGATLGRTFEELAAVLDGLKEPERVGVCFDTCHVFAAGYDLRSREAYEATVGAFDRTIGLRRLEVFHLNDSRKELGCRVDRHEHIGRGCLGLDPFRWLINDPRFRNRPMVLETPKEDDMDRRNLEVLRSLAS